MLSDPVLLTQLLLALGVSGVVAGLIAGLLGVGGGIVLVPVLYFLFQVFGTEASVAIHAAVGTSLATIIATSISSVLSHHKKGAVDWPLLKKWSVFVVIGVVIGTLLAAVLDGIVLVIMFGCLAFFVALKMFFSKAESKIADQLPGQPLEGIFGAFIGTVSVMVGIGGGSISVPILTAYGYEMKRAVASSSGIGLIIAIPGAIGFMMTGWSQEGLPIGSIGYVNLIGFALIVPLTVTFAPLGAKLAHIVNAQKLKKAFAIFLFLTSIKMILGAF